MLVRPNALLLDVDGVVYRNQKVLKKVAKNIVRYVERELNMDYEEAHETNRLLYTQFGHTYTGLRALYNIDKSIDHFNALVYDQKLLSDVATNLDEFVVNDSVTIRCLAEECKMKDIDLFLFTNAPSEWCHTILKTMKLESYINETNIISCDHDVLEHGMKPTPYVYDTLSRYISHKNHDEVGFMFVDDSLQNLIPLINAPQWQPIFLNNNGVDIKSRKIPTIHGLQDLQTLL